MNFTDLHNSTVNRILKTNNPYEILELPRNANDKQVRSAFNKLVLLTHPDKNKSPGAQEAFCAVVNASGILLDENKRKKLDDLLNKPEYDDFLNSSDEFNLSGEELQRILAKAALILGTGLIVGISWKIIFDYFQNQKRNHKNRQNK